MRENFTIGELKAIDSELMTHTMASIDFYKTVPLSMVCANPSTPWWVSLRDPWFTLEMNL